MKGEETRILVCDAEISRGWEASSLLAIGADETENLVMRATAFCFLIKGENIMLHYFSKFTYKFQKFHRGEALAWY